MKKIKYLLIIMLVPILMLSVHADGLNPLVYQYTNPEVTVEFSEPLNMSAERQQSIADEIAGVESNSLAEPGVASPDNLICTIFGHNLSDPVTVTARHHKVNSFEPRCKMEVYDVVYCTRCDYTNTELFDSFYIFCCPED